MKAGQTLIGGRYQYKSTEVLKKNQVYEEFRAYDKTTKKQLLLQIHAKSDRILQSLRDIKFPFIWLIFDIVELDKDYMAVFFQPGLIVNLQQLMSKTQNLLQQDALVIFKYLVLGVRQMHHRMLIYGRVCLSNVFFCSHSLIKLGHNLYDQHIPLNNRPPQVLQGKNMSYASDVYMLGITLYQLIYGCLPFQGNNQTELLKNIKGKKLSKKKSYSPLEIMTSRESHFLVLSMLDYYQQNRPSIEVILDSSCLAFAIQTSEQFYLKPKGSIIPQPFYKRYMVYKPTKILRKHGNYYQQNSYLVLNTRDKIFMTLYCIEIRMFEAEPRRIESYYDKLRAIRDNYTEYGCEFIARIDDCEKFRQQPVIVCEYCNQGNLQNYLQKRKVSKGWLSQSEINTVIYVLAVGMKQMKDMGITSIHTISAQRVMIHNGILKLRQPGMLTPSIEKKLQQSQIIDYFAPELKQKLQFVELDKTDMWSIGIMYYFLLNGSLPSINDEGHLSLDHLKTTGKNRNLIGRCLDYSVSKRENLQSLKIEGVDQALLQQILQENRLVIQQKQKKQEQKQSSDSSQGRNDKVNMMFIRSKKKTFKHYNKILSESSTKKCRVIITIVLSLLLLMIVFFGTFIINGGISLLKINVYRAISLKVPYNFRTSFRNITILTISGINIDNNYRNNTYEQFVNDLRCIENKYQTDSPGLVNDYINNYNSIYCFFGFITVLLFCVMHTLRIYKLDLPSVLHTRKVKKNDKQLYHFIILSFIQPCIMFCFFYSYALQYLIQTQPCLGISNLAYPQFTSIDTLLSGNTSKFMLNVFLTVILWSTLMLVYGLASLLIRKVNNNIYTKQLILPTMVIMLIYFLLCRIGFGSDAPLEPSWSYRMNLDIMQIHQGVFGFFPQLFCLIIFVMARIIDFVFWFFLKLGLQPPSQENINQVQIISAKLQSNEKNNVEKSNIYFIDHDFERFD